MPRIDNITLAIFGDHDAGFGKTYAQEADDIDDELDDKTDGKLLEDFIFGKLKVPAAPPSKRSKVA